MKSRFNEFNKTYKYYKIENLYSDLDEWLTQYDPNVDSPEDKKNYCGLPYGCKGELVVTISYKPEWLLKPVIKKKSKK